MITKKILHIKMERMLAINVMIQQWNKSKCNSYYGSTDKSLFTFYDWAHVKSSDVFWR
jgi:hypothetical protein